MRYCIMHSLHILHTPYNLVHQIIDILSVGPYDIFVDMGCGDGRLTIEAAKRGATSICIEIDRILCNTVEIVSKIVKVNDKVTVICRNMFDIDLSSISPTIVYLYHYSSTLEKLSSKLVKELKPGTVVVSLDSPLKEIKPLTLVPVGDISGSIWLLWIYLIE